MPNVITLYGQDDRIVGRCNQHCYNAVDPKRACICGGINNGVGLAQARSNVPKVLKHIAGRPNPTEHYTIKVLADSQGQHLVFTETEASHLIAQTYIDSLCHPDPPVNKKPANHP